MTWQKIAIVGTGLLGGSLALAIKKYGLAEKTAAYVRRPGALMDCQKMKIADLVSQDLHEVVSGADLVVFGTPVAQMRALAEKMAPMLRPGAIVTDVGSVKEEVVREIEPIISKAGGCFVGSHPMAGSEQTGVLAAHAAIFEETICVVTPHDRTDSKALKKVELFWTSMGATAIRLSPAKHDDLVSRSSHLPHIVAAELSNYVLSPVHEKEQALLCANGFKDTTRIASGSPEMWRDIAMANRRNLSRVLGVFIEDLQEFQRALDHRDAAAISQFFEGAKQRRDEWDKAFSERKRKRKSVS